MPKEGYLLINVGTPEAPTTQAVSAYLKEFLMDPYMIQLPTFFRALLVYGLIVPLRKRTSSEAYQAIWRKEGSPQRYYMEKLAQDLQAQASDKVVAYGMRYGNPSIENAFGFLLEKGCASVVVIPLYPQYAEATTRSSMEAVIKWAREHSVPVKWVKAFYDQPHYIEALANSVRSSVDLSQIDCLLMSYHGLPYQQLQKIDQPVLPACIRGEPCPSVTAKNQDCYRAHCFATSNTLAQALHLNSSQYRVSFQSRIGRQRWIQPYTVDMLSQLANEGVKNLAVICPAFVIDCLETLEEIGIRAKAQWKVLGGNDFHLISCLNNSAKWVSALSVIARQGQPISL